MALISHYVVTYNHTTKKFELDEGTAELVFRDGLIYDEENSAWIPDDLRTGKVHDADMEGARKLFQIVEDFNNENGD